MFAQRDSREQATVLLFDSDKARKEEVVKLNSMDRILKVVPDFKAEKDEPWYAAALTVETTRLMRQVDLGFARGITSACTEPRRT